MLGNSKVRSQKSGIKSLFRKIGGIAIKLEPNTAVYGIAIRLSVCGAWMLHNTIDCSIGLQNQGGIALLMCMFFVAF